MDLIIVESPAKEKTLSHLLGKNYQIIATKGHIRDLPRKRFGINIEEDFKPSYLILLGKGKIIKQIRELAKGADKVFLGLDSDREGEFIAFCVYNELKSTAKNIQRITYQEITEEAVKRALDHPHKIDLNLVGAQKARRLLDRIVGYKVSPLLWRKVRKGLSAGRVQSVALRFICEREEKISSFKSEEYWNIAAKLTSVSNESAIFVAQLIKHKDKIISKLGIEDKKSADNILEDLKKAKYKVENIVCKNTEKHAPPPFITSSLQQEAAQRLHFRARKTMTIAQQLYEGLNVGKGERVGLISYIRTDSFYVAHDAIQEARSYIGENFGLKYLPSEPKHYKSRRGAQKAHEAIRPTDIKRTPKMVKQYLDVGQYNLYNLIWCRFLASQMQSAIIGSTIVDISANDYIFRSRGIVVQFNGFAKIYPIRILETTLPPLSQGEELNLIKLIPKQSFTQPPARYSEATLIKALEKNGIGRPSTYVPIMETIQNREYVEKWRGSFKPTFIGKAVSELLVKNFPDIFSVPFTSQMEKSLDAVANGKEKWVNLLRAFYTPFVADLARAYKEMRNVKQELTEKTNKSCPKCSSPLVIKYGRFGKFLACSNFPKCRYSRSLTLGIRCPRKDCSGEIVRRRTKKRMVFYGCSNYPECDFSSWDKPAGKSCPECGSFLVEKYSKSKGKYLKCSNKGCSYQEIQKVKK